MRSNYLYIGVIALSILEMASCAPPVAPTPNNLIPEMVNMIGNEYDEYRLNYGNASQSVKKYRWDFLSADEVTRTNYDYQGIALLPNTLDTVQYFYVEPESYVGASSGIRIYSVRSGVGCGSVCVEGLYWQNIPKQYSDSLVAKYSEANCVNQHNDFSTYVWVEVQ